MKAVILARVSSREQEEGHSIQAQIDRLQGYCARKSLQIIQTCQITESSTRGERKKFHEMLGFIKSQKETIALVADAVDRVQRSFRESVMLDDLIKREKIELHFYRENMILNNQSNSMDIMRWDFSVMGAKSYVLQLSENVRRSMQFKVKNGELIGKAPIGYLNVRDSETGKSNIILDKERAFLVKRLFEEYATGAFTLGEMEAKAKQWGLSNKTRKKSDLSKSQIHLILQNPFYYGEMNIKGVLHKHKYEPLISYETFEKCQQVRLSWGKKPHKYSEKPFIFRGLIKCAISGRTVTADLKKGRYIYLVCYDPENPDKRFYVKESEVLDQIKDVFKSLEIPADVLEAVQEHLKHSFEAEKEFHKEAIQGLEKESTLIQVKLDRLLDLLLEKSITQDEYAKKNTELKQRQYQVTNQLQTHHEADEQFRTTVSTLFSLINRAHVLFESSKTEQKRELLNLMFSNLTLRGASLEYCLRKPFDLFVGEKNCQVILGKLDAFRTFGLREMADVFCKFPFLTNNYAKRASTQAGANLKNQAINLQRLVT